MGCCPMAWEVPEVGGGVRTIDPPLLPVYAPGGGGGGGGRGVLPDIIWWLGGGGVPLDLKIILRVKSRI